MSRQPMHTLPKGAIFVAEDGHTYKVTVPASDPHDCVGVWNLTLSDSDVLARYGNPNWVGPGQHPREGFFSYPHPYEVEVVP